MSSLDQEISKLTNPTPLLFDPEDDIDTGISEKIHPEISNPALKETSQLRSKNAPLLEDIDPSYIGRKISRKNLGHSFTKDKESLYNEDTSVTKNTSDDSSYSDSEVEESESDDLNENFEMKSYEEQEEEEHSEEEHLEGEESDDSEEDDLLEDNDDSMVQKFRDIDVHSDTQKAQAVKNQKEIWNRLLETRIKLQKLLVISNKMPQMSSLQQLKLQGGKQLNQTLNQGCEGLRQLLNSCLDLQSEMIEKNSEIQDANDSAKETVNQNEEIPSDTDGESEAKMETVPENKTLKRKAKNEDFDAVLAKRFKLITPYRNSVIQKWDEKTRISTGRFTQKSFMAFDSSALKQISQILQDKNRLIKRTQLKRSLYRIIGKNEAHEQQEELSEEAINSKQDMQLKDYDPEIFDDDDFYRQILKDVIESKSFGIDPAIVRKQMEIQKIRNKMKRKVDTKASKGRKLRFDIHPKLVNFMAPVQIASIPDNARENLMKCLLGRVAS